MTHEVKHEIRHADKNVIDLEDTIDEDAVEIEDEPSGDEEQGTSNHQKILGNLHKSILTRNKKKASFKSLSNDEKKLALSNMMKRDSKISFTVGGSGVKGGPRYTKDFAGLILTRWARRQLNRIREKRVAIGKYEPTDFDKMGSISEMVSDRDYT